MSSSNPFLVKHKKLQEAIEILQGLGVPMQKHAEMRGHILIALMGIRPEEEIATAKCQPIGITPIIEFINTYYRNEGNEYKPNTRETVRDEGVHYFKEAGIVIVNPDRPDRPKNSPRYVYQLEPVLQELLKAYGTPTWNEQLLAYKLLRPTLSERYAQERDLLLVPLVVNDEEIRLSPGEHSVLIKKIVEEFAPRFAPGSQLVYLGDTGEKWGYYDKPLAERLGILVFRDSKMPDVILYDKNRNWLYLVESVTSNGPVDGKRYDELSRQFGELEIGLVYVTAFPTRQMMAKFVSELMWDTEVWIASDPTHLIHFNGDRFLGPR